MNHATAEQLIEFETGIKELWEAGELPFLTHLCGGNEEELVRIFARISPGDWIFASHRAHYHALLAGIEPEEVEAKIRAGQSMFIYSKKHNFCVSAVLAGTCAIAAGVAWALREAGSDNRVWCFLGDGGEEQGHFYEAAMFVEGNNLPCMFIIEDNNRQVNTTKTERNRVYFGLDELFTCVRRYRYEPTYGHADTDKPRSEIKFKC